MSHTTLHPMNIDLALYSISAAKQITENISTQHVFIQAAALLMIINPIIILACALFAKYIKQYKKHSPSAHAVLEKILILIRGAKRVSKCATAISLSVYVFDDHDSVDYQVLVTVLYIYISILLDTDDDDV